MDNTPEKTVNNFGFKSVKTPPKNEHLNAFNLYKLSKDNYNKLLTENITKSYKKTNTAAINNINKEAKCIAERLHLDDRVEQFNQPEAFVTLDHGKL